MSDPLADQALLAGAMLTMLLDPDAWCQGDWARDDAGNKLPLYSADATRWCLSAARFVATDRLKIRSGVSEILNIRMKTAAGGADCLWIWNDDPIRTHADIVALLEHFA